MASEGLVHVVGVGLAGLAAAVSLTEAGRSVVLHEATGAAGGRCRSYLDQELGCRVDNGNHLLLSGNEAALGYLRRIGSQGMLDEAPEPAFPFVDLASGERWTLRPGPGRLPLWTFDRCRRVPGSGPMDYLGVLRLARAGREATVAEVLDTSHPLFRRLWGPLAVAALNTEPEAASARCLWSVLVGTFGRGGAACRPIVARHGLSETFIGPALTWLRSRGVEIALGSRARRLDFKGDRVTGLELTDKEVVLGPADRLVLATPAPVAASLVPGLQAPDAFRAILNLHFRLGDDAAAARVPAPGFLGLVGAGLAEWIFVRPPIVSVTVSAADRHLDRAPPELATVVWQDVTRALDLPAGPLPPWRIVKERRATFAATPVQLTRRPGPETRWKNLLLAGDWTDTGLPATIEGAVRSGQRAARLAMA